MYVVLRTNQRNIWIFTLVYDVRLLEVGVLKKNQRYEKKMKLHDKQTEFKKLTPAEKVKDFFVNPRQLFYQYEGEPAIGGLFVIIGILTIGLYLGKSVFDPHAVNNIINSNVGPEAAQELMNSHVSMLSVIITSLLMVLVAYITVGIAAGLYYILIAAFNGKLTYKKSICIYSIAFIASVFGDLIITIFNAAAGGVLNFSAGAYMDVLLSQLNIFHIWSLILVYVGIRAMTKLSKKNIIIIIMIIFIGSTLIKLITASIAQTL